MPSILLSGMRPRSGAGRFARATSERCSSILNGILPRPLDEHQNGHQRRAAASRASSATASEALTRRHHQESAMPVTTPAPSVARVRFVAGETVVITAWDVDMGGCSRTSTVLYNHEHSRGNAVRAALTMLRPQSLPPRAALPPWPRRPASSLSSRPPWPPLLAAVFAHARPWDGWRARMSVPLWGKKVRHRTVSTNTPPVERASTPHQARTHPYTLIRTLQSTASTIPLWCFRKPLSFLSCHHLRPPGTSTGNRSRLSSIAILVVPSELQQQRACRKWETTPRKPGADLPVCRLVL